MTYQPPPEEFAALMRMVQIQAGKVARKAPDVLRDDLISEGHLALVLCLQRYDPAHLATAWTYAEPRVRGAMLDLVQKSRRPQMRKGNKNPAYRTEDIEDHDIEAALDRADARFDAAKALSVLDEKEREIVEMIMAGESRSDVAKILGRSRRGVGRIWKSAVEKMQAHLAER